MTALREEITEDFDTVLTQWTNIHGETKQLLTSLKKYYGDTGAKTKEVVVEKASEDHKLTNRLLEK